MSIDARQRTLHLLPVLQVDPFDRVAPDAISLSVSVDWHDAPPTLVSGWVICQPYPNRHYFVGGSGDCQLGHFVSLPDGQQAGDVSFHWTVVVPGRPPGHCQVTHRLALAFETGVGRMYSMDVANWWSQSEFASQARSTPELGRNRFSRLTPGGISPTRQARVSESIRQGCRYLDIQECLTLPAITLNDCWTLETYGGDNALSCLEALQ
ncbi:hypothetical protein FGL86_11435 [Pistricoccus aurantiacus]|uniref:Uncharacterized protein n=1 Tax=Pistricoccus aurantiacus TaxID=1883414 RepID=A0A5B8SXS0_9GAMM|nr:hypothetical protein [Pistricoccus aurantiacus]QEA39623.1 hypothetical protein FGL86_11435 [Pistricoccus aurantiacus]